MFAAVSYKLVLLASSNIQIHYNDNTNSVLILVECMQRYRVRVDRTASTLLVIVVCLNFRGLLVFDGCSRSLRGCCFEPRMLTKHTIMAIMVLSNLILVECMERCRVCFG